MSPYRELGRTFAPSGWRTIGLEKAASLTVIKYKATRRHLRMACAAAFSTIHTPGEINTGKRKN
jgi:hypothetical protein